MRECKGCGWWLNHHPTNMLGFCTVHNSKRIDVLHNLPTPSNFSCSSFEDKNDLGPYSGVLPEHACS